MNSSLRTFYIIDTLVHRGRELYDVLKSRELSEFLSRLYGERGVELILEDEVDEFVGDGTLRAVRTKGGRHLVADLAVTGVGVDLNLELLEGTGVEQDNGVVVDERYESSVPGIYAIGDVANVADPIAGRRRRIEHWSNATHTGTRLGRILAGEEAGEPTVAGFFSEVFGRSFKVFGDPTAEALATHGSFDDGRALVLYEHPEGGLAGAVLTGLEEPEENELKELIRRRAPLADAAVFARRG